MIDKSFDELERAVEAFSKELERIQATPRINDQIVITSCYAALKHCKGMDGLNPTARKKVTSALAMCQAALGID